MWFSKCILISNNIEFLMLYKHKYILRLNIYGHFSIVISMRERNMKIFKSEPEVIPLCCSYFNYLLRVVQNKFQKG